MGPIWFRGAWETGRALGRPQNGLGVAASPDHRSRTVVPHGVSWRRGRFTPQKIAATFS